MIKTFSYILFYIFFCLIQFFFGQYLNIDGIFPNFILIAIIYLGLSRGRMSAQCMGFLFGLTWDVFSTDVFGVRTIMFTIIGHMAGGLSKSFDKDQIPTQIVIVLVGNIIYWLGFSLIYLIIPEDFAVYKPFAISLHSTLKVAFTVLIAPVVFFVLNTIIKIGKRCE